MTTVMDEREAPRWEPFGVTEEDFSQAADHGGVRVVQIVPDRQDLAGRWLAGAAGVLGVLAAAAAAVSWQAQYAMVEAVKHAQWVAGLEAGIPDAGALVFACLGIALALHGKRAVRPRVLNAACVGISLMQNALAAGAGWRDLAIWVMPSAVYAAASDTLIGVIRGWVLARQHDDQPGEQGPGLLEAAGGLLLWLLRLALAPGSTLSGFRRWVTEDCPVAPGRKAGPTVTPADAAAIGQPGRPALNGHPAADNRENPNGRAASPGRRDRAPGRRGGQGPGRESKKDLLIRLAGQEQDLAVIPLAEVSRLASALAVRIGYSPGTARRELLRYVRALQQNQPGSKEAGGE